MITMKQYAEWLQKIGGDYKSGHKLKLKTGYVPRIILYGPTGLKLSRAEIYENDPLLRSQIEHFNNRLDVEIQFEQSNLKNQMPDF